MDGTNSPETENRFTYMNQENALGIKIRKIKIKSLDTFLEKIINNILKEQPEGMRICSENLDTTQFGDGRRTANSSYVIYKRFRSRERRRGEEGFSRICTVMELLTRPQPVLPDLTLDENLMDHQQPGDEKASLICLVLNVLAKRKLQEYGFQREKLPLKESEQSMNRSRKRAGETDGL